MSESFNLITSVLNDTSLSLNQKKYKAYEIEPDLIHPNKFNFLGLRKIEELKEDILQNGLLDPLVVNAHEDGNGDTYYVLISGHRRFKAITELIEEGHPYETITCSVLHLSDLEEKWVLLQANSTGRGELTDFERMEVVRLTKAILLEKKANGEILTGRQRDLIAQELNMSPAQVQRMDFIQKNMSDEFKSDFEEGKIPLMVAHEVAHLDAKVQDKLHKSTDNINDLTVDKVNQFKQNQQAKEDKKNKTDTLTYDTYIISEKELEQIQQSFFEILKQIKQGKVLNKKEYAKVLTAKDSVIKNLNAIKLVCTKKD